MWGTFVKNGEEIKPGQIVAKVAGGGVFHATPKIEGKELGIFFDFPTTAKSKVNSAKEKDSTDEGKTTEVF